MAVTTRTDLSADMLVQRCAARGISVFRFNSEDYPIDIGLHIDPLDPSTAELLGGDGHVVSLGKARGIWLRRPQWPTISPLVNSEADRRLASQEAVGAAGGAWRLLAAKCVSAPDALQAARWKLPQLGLARELGFAVPESIVSTDRQRASAFFRQGETVIKAVQEAAVQIGSGSVVGYATEAVEDDLDGMVVTAVLLQQKIAKVADWRVTVAGQSVFAARVIAPPGGPLDVRLLDDRRSAYAAEALPDVIANACVAFVKASGLRYGAFDLAEDAEGTLWFLECNPNGQWGWIEGATGLPITDAIIDELMRGTAP